VPSLFDSCLNLGNERIEAAACMLHLSIFAALAFCAGMTALVVEMMPLT
jgi:hypothetical protein